MRPANGSTRRAKLAACAALLVACVGPVGCAGPTPMAPPAPRLARIEIVNLGECDWRVTLAARAGRKERTVQLSARETTRLELPGGDYAITQTALSGIGGADATRQFSAHLDAGESYRWRLVTLFGAAAAAAP